MLGTCTLSLMTSVPTAERETIAQAVAAEIRALAARKRIKQSAVARAIGMSQQALSRRWTGDLPFDLYELEAVASVLGVSVPELIPPTPVGAVPQLQSVITEPVRRPTRRNTVYNSPVPGRIAA